MTQPAPTRPTPAAPTVDAIDLAAMERDPYPTYAAMRAQGTVVRVPALGRHLVTGHAACRAVESDQETYSAVVGGAAATMARTMGGRPMLRKDDPEHAVERGAINPALRPRNLRTSWAEAFARNAEQLLANLLERGPDDADLNRDFAAPVAAKNLIDLLGADGVDPATMHRWSSDLIAGIANLGDDPDVWARCERTGAEIDEMLDRTLPRHRAEPDGSVISALLHGGLPDHELRVNVKLTISGGMNEPQHVVTAMVWALSGHPSVRERVLADPQLWPTVFDETVRWQSPIGLYPRETTRSTVLDGVELAAGESIAVVIAAANRDPDVFANPDVFDIDRPRAPHLGFGSGVHQCAGHWAARMSVGEIAVPMLYDRLPGLRVDDRRAATWQGWVFRGLTALPVTWDA